MYIFSFTHILDSMATNCWINLNLFRALLVLISVIATILIYAVYSTTTMWTPKILFPYLKSGISSSQQLSKLFQVGLWNYKGKEAQDLLHNSSAYPSDGFSPLSDVNQDTGIELQIEYLDMTNQASLNAHNTPIEYVSIETGKLFESGHLNEQTNIEHICPFNGTSTLLLILITSDRSNADARLSIRNTWGDYGKRSDIGIAFVLGRGFNETLNIALNKENLVYRDLIRGNFIDSYRNRTLKVVSALEWTDRHCPHVKYILKADDDSFINVPMLMRLVKRLEKHQEKRAIFGRVIRKEEPDRNIKSKYYNPLSTELYPLYATGAAYLMTGDIVHDLYVRSLKTVYLHIPDVFITGIVAQSLEIDRLNIYEFVNRRTDLTPCNIQGAISLHKIKPEEQVELWQMLFKKTSKCKNNFRYLL